jgi:hypothetical protein
MLKQIFKSLFFIILLTIILLTITVNIQVSANSLSNLISPKLLTEISDRNNFSFSQTNTISVKSGEKYDESKDPALRSGTENWEEPQGSFFAIPAAVLGIILIFLFFNRD